MAARGWVDTRNPVNWSHPLNVGLTAWWLGLPNASGGQTLYDLCGRRPGTLTGGAGWAAGPNGFGGFRTTASSHRVAVARVDLLFPSATDGTLSYWVRRTATASAGYIEASADDAGNLATRVLMSSDYSGVITWDWGGASSGTTRLSVPSAGVDLSWHHWCCTVGGGLGMRVYRDGVMFASNAATPARTVDNRGFQLGNYLGAYAPAAEFADQRAYGRALAADEAWGLYDQGRRGHPDTLRRFRPWVTVAASGSPPGPATAESATTQAGDTASGSAAALVTAAGAATQAGDTGVGAAAVTVAATGKATAAGDSAAGDAAVTAVAASATTQAGDVATGRASDDTGSEVVGGRWLATPVAVAWRASPVNTRWAATPADTTWRASAVPELVDNPLTKHPDDAGWRYAMDLSAIRQVKRDGATVAGVTSVAATPPGLTISGERADPDGKSASAVISGGAEGINYAVKFVATLSTGETVARTGTLRVRA